MGGGPRMVGRAGASCDCPGTKLFGQSRLAPIYGSPKHVTGADLRDTEVVAQKGGLGPFAGAWGTQKNNTHVVPIC